MGRTASVATSAAISPATRMTRALDEQPTVMKSDPGPRARTNPAMLPDEMIEGILMSGRPERTLALFHHRRPIASPRD
jgi:hypothetical protein